MAGILAAMLLLSVGASAQVRDAGRTEFTFYSGDLSCVRGKDASYRCAIGVDMKTGKSVNGTIC